LRKRFVIEREILDLKSHFQREKAMSPQEREIRGLLRPFARFQTMTEHEELVTSLLKEVKLKNTVEQILLAKHVGSQNLEDLERLVFDSDNSSKIDKVIQELKNSLNSGKFHEDSRSKRKRHLETISRAPRGKDEKKSQQRINEDFAEDAKNYGLFTNEQKLSKTLGLKYQEYLLIKEVIIRHSVQHGKINRQNVMSLINLDPHRLNEILNFMTKNQLIVEEIV
jgi:hypothetical protein